MSRCDTDVTYVSEIVVVTRYSSISQGARRIISVLQSGGESLQYLTLGYSCVRHRPPHPFRMPVFPICD
jgi:hypothetical protein